MDLVGNLWEGAVKGVEDAAKGVQEFSAGALQATGDGLKNVGDAITPKGDISIGFVSIKTSGSTRDDGSRVSKEPGRTYHFNRGDAVAQGRLKAAPAGHAHTGYAEARGVKQKSAAEIADERAYKQSKEYKDKQKLIADAKKELAKKDQELAKKFQKLL